MSRPGWWPSGWPWPGGKASPGTARVPDRSRPVERSGASEDPDASFLVTLIEALGAQRAVLFALDREEGVWRAERSASGPDAGPRDRDGLSAAGHPFTWCLREDLVVQVPVSELTADRSGEGWALAGPVRGTSRVLVLAFHGPPPSRARRAMRPALDHLASLADRTGPAGA